MKYERGKYEVDIDGVFLDEGHHRQKKLLEMELESLIIPQANGSEEAGILVLSSTSLLKARLCF